MSTDGTGRRHERDPGRTRSAGTRRARGRRRRGRLFAASFSIVVLALGVVGLSAAAATVALGPRATEVQVDPEAAVSGSGARLIVTATQSLAEVDPDQVTITPSVPFAVDTSGRSVGIRFAVPLRDDTEYTVEIADLAGAGGGPTATVTETFRTPAAVIFLLQRGEDGDTVFRSGVDGEEAVPVFTHDHIEDFRATAAHLVMSVLGDDGVAALIVTDLFGQDARELTLPGEGFVSTLQAADVGERIGYTFSDADLSADGGRESELYTASLADGAAGDAPVQIQSKGIDPRVAAWRFVPDTDSMLVLAFDSTLVLTDPEGGAATTLGTAVEIDGVDGTDAYLQRIDGEVVMDLTDGTERPLVEAEPSPGVQRQVTPVAGDGTVRTFGVLGSDGIPTGSVVAFIADDGTPRVVDEFDAVDSVIRTCVSPNGRYLATLVAPDAIANPYDQYLMPLPERVQTRIVELEDGSAVANLSGFDISWCRVPPQ